MSWFSRLRSEKALEARATSQMVLKCKLGFFSLCIAWRAASTHSVHLARMKAVASRKDLVSNGRSSNSQLGSKVAAMYLSLLIRLAPNALMYLLTRLSASVADLHRVTLKLTC